MKKRTYRISGGSIELSDADVACIVGQAEELALRILGVRQPLSAQREVVDGRLVYRFGRSPAPETTTGDDHDDESPTR